MEILVLVKDVPDRAEPLVVEGDAVKDTGVVYGLGPWEEMALEEALSLKTKHGGTVTAITFGPEKADRGLREAMTMGADQAVRAWAPELPAHDPRSVADALANVCRSLPFDLIIGGVRSSGGSTGLVIPYLGSILNIPVVSGVVHLRFDNGSNSLRVQQQAGKGDRRVLECGLPAALGVEKSENEPRYPTMYGRLASERTPITLWEPGPGKNERPEPLVDLVGLARARPKPKKIFAPDSNLSAAERMKLILSGGVDKKRGPASAASDGESGARQILECLKQSDILKTGATN